MFLVRFVRWIQRLWRGLITDQWQQIQAEVEPSSWQRVGAGAPLLMCWVAVILTFVEYYGHSGSIFYRWFRAAMPSDSMYAPVFRHVYWSLSCSAAYFVLPVLAILLTPRARIRDYGLSLKGFRQHMWIYVLLFLIVMPAVIVVSYTPPFQRTYPFYHLASRSGMDLTLWWTFYGIQFFCLEFFFRGYILHGLKRSVGVHGILFSAVPYCMIHFGKPMLETLGAIIAGVALGTLSLRTRSIWSGFLIHISVAFSMDVLSMWQKGRFSLFM